MLLLGLNALLFIVLPRATQNNCLNGSKKFFFTLIIAEEKNPLDVAGEIVTVTI